MTTSYVELNKSPTIVALLPLLSPCHGEYPLSGTVFGAIPAVGVALADGASACATFRRLKDEQVG